MLITHILLDSETVCFWLVDRSSDRAKQTLWTCESKAKVRFQGSVSLPQYRTSELMK